MKKSNFLRFDGGSLETTFLFNKADYKLVKTFHQE
jgi:hypothetical protein